MNKERFCKIADKYIKANFSSRSDCSRNYGCHYNYISRCFSGERPFPEELVRDVGFKKQVITTENYVKLEE
jgi:hypothetical protein